MTLDEALGKVTDPEVRNFLDKVIKDQNSYVTKLETQLKSAPKPAVSGGTETNDITMRYLEKNMRRDVIEEACQEIQKTVSKEIFDAVKADYDKFLGEKMDKAHTTVEYATDAFSLVLGRCMRDPNHPVNKIGKSDPTPAATPTVPTATNGQAVKGVNDILSGQPPIMTNSDPSSAQGAPAGNPNPIKNTRDAMSTFRNKFAQLGGNKFQ